jgi:NAD(P)-dependent dehydrogenase (short-subunit alcohol dehydrogenase family)
MPKPAAPLDGRHALITGGGTGIGAAIARTLAGAGAAVSIAGRRAGPLEAVAANLPRAKAIVADVTSEADTVAIAAAARAAHGPIDIVIANAGAAESAPIAKAGLAHWQRMLDVNLTGAFLTVKAAMSDITQGPGARERRIIFISSTAGLKGYAYVAAYCAAKHGLIGLTRALAAELRQTGVTVNAVCPGFTHTPLLDSSIANVADTTGRTWKEAARDLAAFNPQGGFIQPDEIAETVLWLCTPAARSITGQAISVSGGEI